MIEREGVHRWVSASGGSALGRKDTSTEGQADVPWSVPDGNDRDFVPGTSIMWRSLRSYEACLRT